MTIFDFTVEEKSLAAIYRADTKEGTVAAVAAALPYMDADFVPIAESAVAKLRAMGDGEYAAELFTLADETEGAPYAEIGEEG